MGVGRPVLLSVGEALAGRGSTRTAFSQFRQLRTLSALRRFRSPQP